MDHSHMENALNTTPGWYRGELHAHTTFSDGALTPQELIALASAQGLDFLAITDHNSIQAFQHPIPMNEVLIIPGAEITMENGHFNAFGLTGHQDWMEAVFIWPQKLQEEDLAGSAEDLIREISAAGHLVSINHPLLTPWAWEIGSLPLSVFDCLEVWNDPSWPDNRQANPAALDMWTRWLNEGYRLTAVGGSDYHRPRPQEGLDKPAERLGYPATFIYTERLSGSALLESLRQMRAYVSLGPRIWLEGRLGGKTYTIGADLGTITGLFEVAGSVSAVGRPMTARIIRNGICVQETTGSGEEMGVKYQEQLREAEPAWFRLDVLDQNGNILAFTNPIFTGPRPTPAKLRFEDFL
jgi:hypothetical protein